MSGVGDSGRQRGHGKIDANDPERKPPVRRSIQDNVDSGAEQSRPATMSGTVIR
jgi:hypothetical protein